MCAPVAGLLPHQKRHPCTWFPLWNRVRGWSALSVTRLRLAPAPPKGEPKNVRRSRTSGASPSGGGAERSEAERVSAPVNAHGRVWNPPLLRRNRCGGQRTTGSGNPTPTPGTDIFRCIQHIPSPGRGGFPSRPVWVTHRTANDTPYPRPYLVKRDVVVNAHGRTHRCAPTR